MTDRTRVLFVCTYNAGRSALAAALARAHFSDCIDAGSAGVSPQEAPSAVTIGSLAELGIDDSRHVPTALTPERVAAVDIVIAMKPGLDIPQVDGVRYETWSLPDPDGWDIDSVRALREEIARHVSTLIGLLETQPTTPVRWVQGAAGPQAQRDPSERAGGEQGVGGVEPPRSYGARPPVDHRQRAEALDHHRAITPAS